MTRVTQVPVVSMQPARLIPPAMLTALVTRATWGAHPTADQNVNAIPSAR